MVLPRYHVPWYLVPWFCTAPKYHGITMIPCTTVHDTMVITWYYGAVQYHCTMYRGRMFLVPPITQHAVVTMVYHGIEVTMVYNGILECSGN